MAESKIDELYQPLLKQLPASLLSEDGPHVLRPERLPAPAKRFSTDRLICQKGWHFYGSSYRVDTVQFLASREMYRVLGLWMLSVVLGGEMARSRLDLTHPLSDVSTLIAQKEEPGEDEAPRPADPAYTPLVVEQHPFVHDRADVWDLPCFTLTNHREMIVTEEDHAARNRIVGFGSTLATTRLALLLLDFGRRDNMVLEIDLEEEAGYRGVSPTSAEARFALPGSDAWKAIVGGTPELAAGEPEDQPA